jgi:hypothetical protein
MLKSISAALLAASILAAPAMAAGTGKSDVVPAPAAQTSTTKAVTGKTLGARASMHKGRHHRHHLSHKMTGIKHTAHVIKAKAGVKHLSAVKTGAAKIKG